MKRLILVLLLIPSLSFGALSEHYVTTTGTDTWANCVNSGTPCSWATMLTNAVAGDRVNVKSGTYARGTATDAFTNAGTSTNPIVIRGYASSITDGYLGRTNGNGALDTTNMPAITYTTTGGFTPGQAFILYESLNITSARSGTTITLAADSALTRCKVTNSSTNGSAAGVQAGSRCVIFNNDIELTGASGGLAAVNCTNAAFARVIANRIKGGPNAGITVSSGTSVVAFNTIFVGATSQITTSNTGGNVTYIYNTIVGGTGSADGINILTGTTGLQCIIGNMITDNAGDGVDMVSTGNAAFTANNRFRDNANAYNNQGLWIDGTSYNDVTSGAGTSDYIGGSGSSGDYRILPTSPARVAGQPLFADIGALQDATPTPTPTSTATPTSTSTPTSTATATSTATPSATVNCAAVCPTATATPSATFTPTATATATFTPTSTPTSTFTPTATFTPTPTSTATASFTPCAICQPTATPFNCLIGCPTATATPSATFTPTATPSSTFTPTATATWTPTPTATASSTSTPTATASATFTPTPTATTTPCPPGGAVEFSGGSAR